YVWGLDLSGSPQGAGGVGGLLEVSCHGTQTTNTFAAHDGNGNVMALVNSADGTLVAGYDYGPFGEVIRATGPMAKANPFRFSTKYQDDESELVCYPYRFYSASTGRWLSRDPIDELGFDPVAFNRKRLHATSVEQFSQQLSQRRLRFRRSDLSVLIDALSEEVSDNHLGEKGGLNLYEFSRNDAVDNFDALGLIDYADATCTIQKRLKKGMCWWQCTCPRGYSMGFESSVDIGPCDRTPHRTCFKLDCWDYTKVAVCTVVVVGVIILSDGTAIPILA